MVVVGWWGVVAAHDNVTRLEMRQPPPPRASVNLLMEPNPSHSFSQYIWAYCFMEKRSVVDHIAQISAVKACVVLVRIQTLSCLIFGLLSPFGLCTGQ